MMYLCPLCRGGVEETIDGWRCCVHGDLKSALVAEEPFTQGRPVEMGDGVG